MKRLTLLLSAAVLLLAACNAFDNYGTKLNIAEKFDVYYKGDNVSEAEAKKLGDFWMQLRKQNNITEEQALQLTKDGDAYVVHIPAKPEELKENKEKTIMQMWIMQDLLSQGAFDGKKTKIVLTDEELKTVETLEELHKVKVEGDKPFTLYYRGNGLDEKEAKNVADKLVESEFISYTAGDAILTREKGDYEIRFFPNEEMQQADKQGYLSVLQRYQYIISKYGLEGEEVRLYLIDQNFSDVEDFEALPEDQRLAIDQAIEQQMAGMGGGETAEPENE